jgi:beta-lactam-binding protein with PASTA domain
MDTTIEGTNAIVPNAIGMGAQEAEAAIRAAVLNPIFNGSQVNSKVKSQEPLGGTVVEKNSDVTLTMVEMVAVPDVFGKKAQEAEAAIRAAGLIPIFDGSVKSQEPPASTVVEKNSEVTLHMRGDLTIVPRVVGERFEDARRKIQDAELRESHTGPILPPNIVKRQDPERDAVVLKNSRVHLTMGLP